MTDCTFADLGLTPNLGNSQANQTTVRTSPRAISPTFQPGHESASSGCLAPRGPPRTNYRLPRHTVPGPRPNSRASCLHDTWFLQILRRPVCITPVVKSGVVQFASRCLWRGVPPRRGVLETVAFSAASAIPDTYVRQSSGTAQHKFWNPSGWRSRRNCHDSESLALNGIQRP